MILNFRGVRVALALAVGSAPASASERSLLGFAGVMTDNKWEEAIQPGQTEFLDSYLLGGAVAWDGLATWRRLSFGIEAQLVGHAGEQDHIALNVPAVVRYRPARPWPPALDSAAFGMGLSLASKIPQTEINRDGASDELMIYWMAELAWDLGRSDYDLVTRLHHRSDGYGIMAEDSGSNAFVIGLRRAW